MYAAWCINSAHEFTDRWRKKPSYVLHRLVLEYYNMPENSCVSNIDIETSKSQISFEAPAKVTLCQMTRNAFLNTNCTQDKLSIVPKSRWSFFLIIKDQVNPTVHIHVRQAPSDIYAFMPPYACEYFFIHQSSHRRPMEDSYCLLATIPVF